MTLLLGQDDPFLKCPQQRGRTRLVLQRRDSHLLCNRLGRGRDDRLRLCPGSGRL